MKNVLWGVVYFCVSVLLVCSAVVPSSAFNLPDTGQTKCYQTDNLFNVIPCSGTGQDGAHIVNPLSYTDNGDGTVTDNNTGLMWQKRDDGNSYNWYQSTGTYDILNPTSQSVCGSLTLGGYSDWRLPSLTELMDIVDYGTELPDPTIDITYFSHTGLSGYCYWSSTSVSPQALINGSIDYAWCMNFGTGQDATPAKYTGTLGMTLVRCVRGGQTIQSLTANGDGTVTDSRTGLTWQQAEPGHMLWDAALSYCDGLSLGGHADWRVPNIKELESLVDYTKYNPAINVALFPDVYTFPYWSSSYGAIGDFVGTEGVDFTDGSIHDYSKTIGSGPIYVRCVRGGHTSVVSLDHIVISPASATISAGSSQVYTAMSYDASNNSLGDVTASTTFSITPDSSCTAATCTANTPGQHTVTGNDSGKTATAILNVSAGTYTLNVTNAGAGSGSVTSSPTGLNCGATCVAQFAYGAVVTLTAMPGGSSTFTGWSGGGCTGTGTCTITMNSDINVTATFASQTSCTYTFSPTNKAMKANGGALSVKVTASGQSNCPALTIGEHNNWINQSGNIIWKKNKGTVKLSIQKNTSSQSRTGEIWIGDSAVTITESGLPCQVSALKPSSEKFTDSGTGSFNVTVSPQDCPWEATTSADWIHLDTLAVMGNGSAAFHIDANTTGKSRTGKIDVSILSLNANKIKTFSVKQK